MNRIKNALFSENGMKLVNALFFLSSFIRNRGIIFVAYITWIIYLVYCCKHTRSKATARIYKALIAYAAGILLLNAYFYVKFLGLL